MYGPATARRRVFTRTTGSNRKGLDTVADLSKIVNDLSNLTVLEAAELAKILEERWDRGTIVPEFISEDDLKTFEGWLRYQAGDMVAIPPDQLAMLRVAFDKGRERSLATPKVGLMKLQPIPGQHLYAVAVREDSDLWLTLWVRRSQKGEYFVMVPRGDRDWDAHISYHLDGTRHAKSFGRTHHPQKFQPLTGAFRGAVNLGTHKGHFPKSVGAVCDPTAFNGVVEVAPGVLGGRDGAVIVDLVEPGCEPLLVPDTIIRQEIFRDTLPWIVIRIAS